MRGCRMEKGDSETAQYRRACRGGVRWGMYGYMCAQDQAFSMDNGGGYMICVPKTRPSGIAIGMNSGAGRV